MATQVTGGDRRIVGERSHLTCEIRVVCDGARATEISHRVAKGMGGTSRHDIHKPSYLLHACHACHRHIEANPQQAAALGWKIPPGEDSTSWPAWCRPAELWLDWWLARDDGSWVLGWNPKNDLCRKLAW